MLDLVIESSPPWCGKPQYSLTLSSLSFISLMDPQHHQLSTTVLHSSAYMNFFHEDAVFFLFSSFLCAPFYFTLLLQAFSVGFFYS